MVVRRIRKKIQSVFNKIEYNRFIRKLDDRDHTAVFAEIYKKNLWLDGESRSGAGSEIAYTENLRKHLPLVFERFKIKTIIDAPCGDFNWMRQVSLEKDMSYVGIDIVPDVIHINQEKYGDSQHRFIVSSILQDALPKGDILICRDCLFHFSNKDIVLALKNFVDSGIPLLLTSTHINTDHFINTDIKTGEFRRIDLFAKPFSLPQDILYSIEDYIPPYPARLMCLWSRAQVSLAVAEMIKNI